MDACRYTEDEINQVITSHTLLGGVTGAQITFLTNPIPLMLDVVGLQDSLSWQETE